MQSFESAVPIKLTVTAPAASLQVLLSTRTAESNVPDAVAVETLLCLEAEPPIIDQVYT